MNDLGVKAASGTAKEARTIEMAREMKRDGMAIDEIYSFVTGIHKRTVI
jgi:hypothetical protein